MAATSPQLKRTVLFCNVYIILHTNLRLQGLFNKWQGIIEVDRQNIKLHKRNILYITHSK